MKHWHVDIDSHGIMNILQLNRREMPKSFQDDRLDDDLTMLILSLVYARELVLHDFKN